MELDVLLLPAQSSQSRGGTCFPAALGTSVCRQALPWVKGWVPITLLLGWAERNYGRRKAPEIPCRRGKQWKRYHRWGKRAQAAGTMNRRLWDREEQSISPGDPSLFALQPQGFQPKKCCSHPMTPNNWAKSKLKGKQLCNFVWERNIFSSISLETYSRHSQVIEQ